LTSIVISSFIFSAPVDLGLVENNKIDEASGIASSLINKGIIWVHNDSGDMARLYAVGLDGSNLGKIRMPAVFARDWEDMCIGPGPKDSTDYIYIGDIGNNFSKKEKMKIYRFEEPIINLDSISIPFDIKITKFDKIIVSYPDQKRDAEALMIDPITKDLYVLTKRESSPLVYRIPYPHLTTTTSTAEMIGEFIVSPHDPYHISDRIVAADISRDGLMVLIKTMHDIILVKRDPKEPLSNILKEKQIKLEYIIEPQGEALCWKWDQSGYYTMSEEPNGIPTHLYFYPMK